MTAEFEFSVKLESTTSSWYEDLKDKFYKMGEIITEINRKLDPKFLITHIFIQSKDSIIFLTYDTVQIKVIFYVETYLDKLNFMADSCTLLSVFFTDQQNPYTYTGWYNILHQKDSSLGKKC